MRAMAASAMTARYSLPRRPLPSGAAINNVSGDKQWQYYEINVPDGAESLTVELTDLDGNCDLYIRRGRLPSDKENDRSSKRSGRSDETIAIKQPKPAVYFIGVYGNHDVLNGVKYRLTATVADAAPGTEPSLNKR